MTNNPNFHFFNLPGTGRILADLERDDLPPIIQFEDGTHCFGLPRTQHEILPLGYESIAEANFVHEAIHLFVSSKCQFIESSILYRAGHHADFTEPEIWKDAMAEEKLVLGLQIAVNDTVGDGKTTQKVGGFLLHIAGAAREYARIQFREIYSLNLDSLVDEFGAALEASGCIDRVFRRCPRLEFRPGATTQRGRIELADIMGDYPEAYDYSEPAI